MVTQHIITVMGSYVADLAFRTNKLPAWGETYMGNSFHLGPGGKGSNQAVAAARAGAPVRFIGKIGNDTFGELARSMYKREGIDAQYLFTGENATGAAAILLDAESGENAIVVVPGAGLDLTPEEVESARDVIASSSVFVTQLELSLATVEYGLRLAHALGVTTILNPAPGYKLSGDIFSCCDYVTPNEWETELITGIRVSSPEDAERAAGALLELGARNAVITLGAQGAFVKNRAVSTLVPVCNAGPVVETTGAGDSFNGAFAVALTEGCDLVNAARFGCAAAGISVTRAGTATSMPQRSEIDALMTVR